MLEPHGSPDGCQLTLPMLLLFSGIEGGRATSFVRLLILEPGQGGELVEGSEDRGVFPGARKCESRGNERVRW